MNKARFFFLTSFLLIAFGSTAQDTTKTKEPIADMLNQQATPADSSRVSNTPMAEKSAFTLKTKAIFKDGNVAFAKKVQDILTYPAEARQAKYKDSLLVSFVIDKAGVVRDIQLISEINYPPDKTEEAKAEFKKLIEGLIINAIGTASEPGTWTAAINDQDKPVAMRKKIPVVFNPFTTKTGK